MKPRRTILLTFDAFGTLITPREPIAKQYADTARKHGLSGFTEESVAGRFRAAYKQESKRNPNYGKATGLGPHQWWTNIIRSVFGEYSKDVPKELVADLINRFSSSRGYKLYPDVLPFFQLLRNARQIKNVSSPLLRTSVGVLSNSDDRIPLILSDLGLDVGKLRYHVDNSALHPDANGPNDIDFVALSYDIGHEKPSAEAFGAARRLGTQVSDGVEQLFHVGDDVEKDVRGAGAAGWKGILLDRNKIAECEHGRINDLSRLEEMLR